MERVTISNSKKIFAMKASFKLILQIFAFYIMAKSIVASYNFIASYYLGQCHIISEVDSNIFVVGLTAIGGIVSTLNIADGWKGHEPQDSGK